MLESNSFHFAETEDEVLKKRAFYVPTLLQEWGTSVGFSGTVTKTNEQ